MKYTVNTTFYGATDNDPEYIKVTHREDNRTVKIPFNYSKPDPHGHAVNEAISQWETKKFVVSKIDATRSGRGWTYDVDVED